MARNLLYTMDPFPILKKISGRPNIYSDSESLMNLGQAHVRDTSPTLHRFSFSIAAGSLQRAVRWSKKENWLFSAEQCPHDASLLLRSGG